MVCLWSGCGLLVVCLWSVFGLFSRSPPAFKYGHVPSSPELAMAWAALAQRESNVAAREAAAARAEERNEASAQQLAELRRRFTHYGLELEEGIASLADQQVALQEHRDMKDMQVRRNARVPCDAHSAVAPWRIKERSRPSVWVGKNHW